MGTLIDGHDPYRSAVMHNPDLLKHIDRDIPMPDFKHSVSKYPWREMLIGDSFLADGKKAATFSAYCRDKGKKLDRQYRCRDTEDGVRVWRTA